MIFPTRPSYQNWPRHSFNLSTIRWSRILRGFFFFHFCSTPNCSEQQNSLGRVSIMNDIWSHQNLEGYMVITAHYCMKLKRTGKLEIKSQLVAFHHVKGSHTGVNIGEVFVKVIKEIGCLYKVKNSVFFIPKLFCETCFNSLEWSPLAMHQTITPWWMRLSMS